MSTVLAQPARRRGRAGAAPTCGRVVLLILDGFGTPRARARQRDRATRACRTGTRLLAPVAAHDDRRVRAARRTARRADGQLGGRASQHRRRPRRLPGLHAHRPRDRDRRVRGQPGAERRDRRRRARGNATLHVLGLLSPGGVHSHERQIAAMVELAGARGVRAIARARLPRRPRHAAARAPADSLAFMERGLRAPSRARASPRSSAATTRWTATSAGSASREAYDLLVDGRAPFTAATAGRRRSRPPTRAARPTSSCKPTAIVGRDGTPATMRDGDVVVFMNFRADRARQMTRALTDPAFDGFRPRRASPGSRTSSASRRYGDEFARPAGRLRPADDPQQLRRIHRRASA